MLPYRFPKKTLFWGQNESSAWDLQAVFPAKEHSTHHRKTKCEGHYHRTTRTRLSAAPERLPLFSGMKYAEHLPYSYAALGFCNNDRIMTKSHRDEATTPPACAQGATSALAGIPGNTAPETPQAMQLDSLYAPERPARHRRYYTNPVRCSGIGREKLSVYGASPFSTQLKDTYSPASPEFPSRRRATPERQE